MTDHVKACVLRARACAYFVCVCVCARAFAKLASDPGRGMRVEDLISGAHSGLRRSRGCDAICIIVLSQIRRSYLIAEADPITC